MKRFQGKEFYFVIYEKSPGYKDFVYQLRNGSESNFIDKLF